MSDAQSTVTYREIKGFPGYRVGDDSSVWTAWTKINLKNRGGTKAVIGAKWRQLKPASDRTGHLRVTLMPGRVTVWVHRLVLEAFVGPCPEGMEACHFPDRNPGNNRVHNLRWDTRKHNQADRVLHGTDIRGEKHRRAKLTDEKVREIRHRCGAGEHHRKVAASLGVGKSTVTRVMNNVIWKHVV